MCCLRPSSVRPSSVVVNFSHFRLLLWNRWTEFDETLQDGRSQRPLPSLCFSGRSEKTRWPPWPLIGWDIFDFSSETADRNSTKLDRKQDLNVLYQVCVFRADRKNKMAALASDWLRHFRLLLWNRWMEFNETWQEARSQCLLPSLCFSGRSEKQDGRPGLWLAETFSTTPLKPLNRIQRNLTGSKISMSSTKFVFFGPIRKTRWPPWPLIGWDIFDFSAETAQQNSTKLDRKQDLNVLYQVCVFWADQKNKMAALASDWLRHFWLLLWNRWMEFNETRQEARSQRPLPSLCFSGRSEKQDGRPGLWLAETFSTSPLKPLNRIQRNLTGSKISMSSTKFVFFGLIGKTRWPPWPLIGWDIFDFSTENTEQNSTKLDRKQDLNVLYQVCVFQADQKNKMAALASDWLRHFLLLLWNRWMEFNETWQEARSQHPLPRLCFSGRSEKQDGRPGLWLAETFSTSRLKPLNGIQWNLTGSKISTSSTKFVFIGPISQQKCSPWLIPQKGGRLYSGARYVALWASCLYAHLQTGRVMVWWWLSVRPGLHPSVHLSQFRTFLLHALTYWAEILHDFDLLYYRSRSCGVTLRQFLARLHFSAEELLLYSLRQRQLGVHMQNVRSNVKVLKLESFCVPFLILNFPYILIYS